MAIHDDHAPAPVSRQLAPSAANPNVSVAVSSPMAAHPNGAGPRPNHIAATEPYPTAIPRPIARRPDIIWTRSNWNHLYLRRRRGRRCYDGCLRGRLVRHRSRSRRRLLPIRCRRRRSSSGRAAGGRLWRRRIGGLGDVSRLNVVHRHIFNSALRATGGQRRDSRECQARGPNVSIHAIKLFHIQYLGRRTGNEGSVKTHTNLRGFCNRCG
jgi:hypothetical protein